MRKGWNKKTGLNNQGAVELTGDNHAERGKSYVKREFIAIVYLYTLEYNTYECINETGGILC